jgi:hypothetical protein
MVGIGMVDVVAVVVAANVDVVFDVAFLMDNTPQDTRPPALLCMMNGLPKRSVLSEATENAKLAQPDIFVLLYRIVVHGSCPPSVLR